MGRMAIILVMSLVLTAGIIGYSINQSKSYSVENVAGFDKYVSARNIAHTGVNMMLRALDRNDTMYVNKLSRGQTARLHTNLMSGVCSVSVKLTNPAFLDTIDITSKAVMMETTKTMTLRLRRRPVPFPTINEAVALRVPAVDFRLTGNPLIDGRNHDMNGTLLAPSANDKPGVGVITLADSITVAGYGSKIQGSQDVKIDLGMDDPSLFVNDYISAADRVFTAGTYSGNMTWGTEAAPQIVYADATAGNIKFAGTISGYGILVVRGSLEISGNFKFRGLVIAYNDVTIEKDTLALTTGTPDIIGGVLMAGNPNSRFEMKGNDKIVYSKDALEMAKYINKLQVYKVIRWYE